MFLKVLLGLREGEFFTLSTLTESIIPILNELIWLS